MNSTSNFTFGANTGIAFDNTSQTSQNVTNNRLANHLLTNYYQPDTSSNHVLFALSQPCVNYNGLHGCGIDPNVVDRQSQIYHQSSMTTHNLHANNYQQRPYAALPYIGRGSCDPDLEMKLKTGASIYERKSTSDMSELSLLEHSLYGYRHQQNEDERAQKTFQTFDTDGLGNMVRGGKNSRQSFYER